MIAKSDEKQQFLIGGAISIARVTCHSPNDTHYSSPIDSLYIRVCLVLIGLIVAEKLARECTNVCHIFAFLANFTLDISRVKAMGETPFLQLVSRAYLAPHQYRFLMVHNAYPCSRRCANFSPLLLAV